MMILSTRLSSKAHGVIYKLFSCLCFVGAQMIIQNMSRPSADSPHPISVNTLLFYQNALGALCFLPSFIAHGSHSFKTRHLKLQMLRVAVATAGLSLYYLTLKYLPLVQSLALNLSSPAFTLLGAYFCLGERLKVSHLCAIALSFLGVLFILLPELTRLKGLALDWVILIPIAAALVLALSKLLTRELSRLNENPKTTALYLLTFSSPVALILAWPDYQLPGTEYWPKLLGLSLLSALAQWSFAQAYAFASVSYLIPFSFSKLVFGISASFLVLHEVPNKPSTWLGMGMLIIAMLLLTVKPDERAKQTLTQR